MVIDNIKEVMLYVEDITEKLGRPIKGKYYIEDLGCPHQPPKAIPKGYGAVYIFVYEHKGKVEFLKIGKANPKSSARFVSQHYGFSAKSTLANSLCNDSEFIGLGLNKDNIKEWMQSNLHRINIYAEIEQDRAITELIEASLHYRFQPRFEGNI